MFLFKKHRIAQAAVTLPAGLSQEVQLRPNLEDKREYCALILSNGLKVTLVSDTQATHASASLTVAVGSHNNPPEWQGLAHFLEHALFLGCKKCELFGDSEDIPVGEFEKYISAHDGEHNAETSDLYTDFVLSVLPDALSGALKHLARFFITPAFDPNFVAHELKAVDAEYHASQNENDCNAFLVMQQLGNPTHPIRQFDCGNIASLLKAGNRTALRNAVMQFYYDYYSPERMTLAIIAPLPIAELRAMVEQFFTHIPTRQVKPNQITTLAYTTNETGRKVMVQGSDQTHKIELVFMVPTQQVQSFSAFGYLLRMFMDGDTGSLNQLLLDKQWIELLQVTRSPVSHTQYCVTISLSLTETAIPHIDQLVGDVFAYINFLQTTEPSMQIFADIKQHYKLGALSAGDDDPLQYANELSQVMQAYPFEDILIANTINQDDVLDPASIQGILAHLNPQNMFLIITSPEVDADLVVPYHGVTYTTTTFTTQQLALWQTQNSAVFALPSANQFMPQNLMLLPEPENIAEASTMKQIIMQDGVNLWHKRDQTFNVPKVDISMFISGKDYPCNPQFSALSTLLAKMRQDNFEQYSAKLGLAGVDVSFIPHFGNVMEIKISMFSDKIELVVTTIIDCIKTCATTPARFAAHKDTIKHLVCAQDDQANSCVQAQHLCDIILKKHAWQQEIILAAIDATTEEDCRQYLHDFFSETQLDLLIMGNITQASAHALGKLVAQHVNCRQPSVPRSTMRGVLQINDGDNLVYNFTSTQANSAVVSYYQIYSSEPKTEALFLLLKNILDPAFYTQLRSREQLGYIVSAAHARLESTNFITFTIESKNHDSSYMQRRIRNFILRFNDKLATMPIADIEIHKQSLAAALTLKAGNLSAEAEKYFAFVNGAYDDATARNIAQAAASITLEELLAFYNTVLLNPNTIRCLTVRTTPKAQPKSCCFIPYQSTLPPVNEKEIMDIEEFKQNARFAVNPEAAQMLDSATVRYQV